MSRSKTILEATESKSLPAYLRVPALWGEYQADTRTDDYLTDEFYEFESVVREENEADFPSGNPTYFVKWDCWAASGIADLLTGRTLSEVNEGISVSDKATLSLALVNRPEQVRNHSEIDASKAFIKEHGSRYVFQDNGILRLVAN